MEEALQRANGVAAREHVCVVVQEDVLVSSMRAAVTEVERDSRRCILLGIEPEEADPELGYIIPSNRRTYNVYNISRFVEKPSREIARSLIESGALWSVFIVASRATTLLGLFEKRAPDIVHGMQSLLCTERAHSIDMSAISALYAQLPSTDFFAAHCARG
jgi:mannose-1-phosphate guanylyltransferase